ncbi:hypothetical protein F5Y16DRAFT_417493 [Xylariaceae sp. FL0255]|nr:hypothetical protein F5Y16DRAFT_417493 [Xylariaceae sp. FL0255]
MANQSSDFMMKVQLNEGQEPTKKIPIAKVREHVPVSSQKIWANYDLLNQILRLHEPTIQSRWVRKTRQERQRILLAHWPEMPKYHRPDLPALRELSSHPDTVSLWKPHEDSRQVIKKDHYMWPYMNQEDLLTSSNMLVLLNSREEGHYADHYWMCLNNAQNPKEYGELIFEHGSATARRDTSLKHELRIPDGLLVLEAQERLLGFLVSFCQLVLGEISPKVFTSPKFQEVPEPQLEIEKASGGVGSLGMMTVEAQYRVPSKLDLSQIELVIRSRLASIEDHLWALRGDPAYFREQLMEIRQHLGHEIKDASGSVGTTDEYVWTGVGAAVLNTAYTALEFFAELQRQILVLQNLYRRYEKKIIPTEDLPSEFLNALVRLWDLLGRMAWAFSPTFQRNFASSVQWRRYFIRHPKTDGSGPWRLEVEKDWPRNTGDPERQMFGLFRILTDDQVTLERCFNQINSYLPWAQNFATFTRDRFNHFTNEKQKFFNQLEQTLEAVSAINFIDFVGLFDPTDRKFDVPVGSPQTKEVVDTRRRSEKSLDQVWKVVDDSIRKTLREYRTQTQQQLWSQNRPLERTPEWTEPEVIPSSNQERHSESFFEMSISDPTISRRWKPGPPPREKQKTRPANVPAKEEEIAPPVALNSAAPIPSTIFVNRRSMKVFEMLFYTPGLKFPPGEVRWKDFVHALASTGLTEITQTGGSGRLFRNKQGQMSITFHEPHPGDKLSFTQARKNGRRLTFNFAWTGNTFRLG